MSTPSGIARCHFLARGVFYPYGSTKEYLAISDFNRERELRLVDPLMAGADGESYSKLISKWKGLVFPEFRIDDVKLLSDYRKKFKAYENMDIRISA